MIYELAAGERARPLFVGLENGVVTHALMEGSCPGQVFGDGLAEPTTAFAWKDFLYSYGAQL